MKNNSKITFLAVIRQSSLIFQSWFWSEILSDQVRNPVKNSVRNPTRNSVRNSFRLNWTYIKVLWQKFWSETFDVCLFDVVFQISILLYFFPGLQNGSCNFFIFFDTIFYSCMLFWTSCSIWFSYFYFCEGVRLQTFSLFQM